MKNLDEHERELISLIDKKRQEVGEEKFLDIWKKTEGFIDMCIMLNYGPLNSENLAASQEEIQNKSDSILFDRQKAEVPTNQNYMIYNQDPRILGMVEEDMINHPSSFENSTQSSGFVPTETNQYDSEDAYLNIRTDKSEKPFTKVLEQDNNPWDRIGEPVSPGMIKFD